MHNYICFESEEQKFLYNWISANEEDCLCFSFNQLLREFSEYEHCESRIEKFQKLVGESDKNIAMLLLDTITIIRETLVLNNIDAEYLFSLLPKNEKNEKIYFCLKKYLNSELSKDKVNAAWNLIGKIKTQNLPKIDYSNWCFVKSIDSKYIFEEMAKSFSMLEQVIKVEILEPWEEKTQIKGHSICIKDKNLKSLIHLVEKVKHLLNKSLKVPIIFDGSQIEFDFFTFLLEVSNINYSIIGFELFKKDHKTNSILTKLRKSEHLSLEEKLEISKKITNTPLRPVSDDEWKSLMESLSINIENNEKKIETRFETTPNVCIFPIGCFPKNGCRSIVFLGKKTEKTESNLLEPWEIEIINKNGFSILSNHELYQRKKKCIIRFLKRPKTTLYSEDDIFINNKYFSLPKIIYTSPKAKSVYGSKPLKISISQLETYITCPMKYFFIYELKLKEEEEHYHTLFGKLTHLTLEKAFSYADINNVPVNNDSFSKILKDFFDRCLKESSLKLSEMNRIILNNDFIEISLKIPEMEKTLSSFFPKATKRLYEYRFLIKSDELNLTGVIDRIDFFEDNKYLLIDYKTGTVDFSPSKVESGNLFQAPIYLTAAKNIFGNSCIGIIFYDLKNFNLKKGILNKNMVSSDVCGYFTRGHVVSSEKYDELLDIAQKNAKEIVEKISLEKISAKPSPSSCYSCSYYSLCREAYGFVKN